MMHRLQELLPSASIEHIGSTAVDGMIAKDVVDVLVGVAPDGVSDSVRVLLDAGFDCEGQRSGHAWCSWPSRRSRSSVIHVVDFDGAQWRARLAFRDVLRREADARDLYVRVKKNAAVQANGWGDYTAAKADVVREILGRWS